MVGFLLNKKCVIIAVTYFTGRKFSGEKVSRDQKIAKFYALTFANDLLQLILRKINFRDQQKSAFRMSRTNFRD